MNKECRLLETIASLVILVLSPHAHAHVGNIPLQSEGSVGLVNIRTSGATSSREVGGLGDDITVDDVIERF